MTCESDVIQELSDFGLTIENNEKMLAERLKKAGSHPQVGADFPIKPIEECADESEYWGQFRGDYLDLRDFFRGRTRDDKKTFLKNLSKSRVILIREHILQTWTFSPEQRERLEDELEAINLTIYSGKDELDQLEADIEDKKNKCGYYKDELDQLEADIED